MRRFHGRLRSMRDRLRAGTTTPEAARPRIASWVAHARHANTRRLRRALLGGGPLDPAAPRLSGHPAAPPGWRGSLTGPRASLRGGSWNNEPENARSANRNRNDAGNRNNNVGFRVASTARGLSPRAHGRGGARKGRPGPVMTSAPRLARSVRCTGGARPGSHGAGGRRHLAPAGRAGAGPCVPGWAVIALGTVCLRSRRDDTGGGDPDPRVSGVAAFKDSVRWQRTGRRSRSRTRRGAEASRAPRKSAVTAAGLAGRPTGRPGPAPAGGRRPSSLAPAGRRAVGAGALRAGCGVPLPGDAGGLRLGRQHHPHVEGGSGVVGPVAALGRDGHDLQSGKYPRRPLLADRLLVVLAGAQAVGVRAARLPPGQPAAALRQHLAGMAAAAPPGGARGLARRGGVRAPSRARRGGGVGDRAQGPALDAVLSGRRPDVAALRRGAAGRGATCAAWEGSSPPCCRRRSPSACRPPCSSRAGSGTGGSPRTTSCACCRSSSWGCSSR